MFSDVRTRRRQLVGAAALVIMVIPLAALAQDGATTEMLQLRLAVTDPNINPVTDSVLKLAETEGYYEKHGVKVEIVRLEGTPQAVAALNAGQVDLADVSIEALLRLRAENGLAIKGIASATLGPPYLIAAKCEITKVQDLVGRSFAIADSGSLDHNLTQHVLAASGVERDGPNFVAIGAPSARVQALAAGRVDATTVSYGTYLPIAATPGLCVVVSPEDFFRAAPIQSKLVAVLESTIAGKGEALKRFVSALVDSSRQYDSDPATWVEAMRGQRDDLSAENLESTTKFLAGRWCVNGCANVEYVQETVDFIYGTPDFAEVKPLTAADITDDSFVAAALAELGPYAGGGIDARP